LPDELANTIIGRAWRGKGLTFEAFNVDLAPESRSGRDYFP
jgi:hypothetical protein